MRWDLVFRLLSCARSFRTIWIRNIRINSVGSRWRSRSLCMKAPRERLRMEIKTFCRLLPRWRNSISLKMTWMKRRRTWPCDVTRLPSLLSLIYIFEGHDRSGWYQTAEELNREPFHQTLMTEDMFVFIWFSFSFIWFLLLSLNEYKYTRVVFITSESHPNIQVTFHSKIKFMCEGFLSVVRLGTKNRLVWHWHSFVNCDLVLVVILDEWVCEGQPGLFALKRRRWWWWFESSAAVGLY